MWGVVFVVSTLLLFALIVMLCYIGTGREAQRKQKERIQEQKERIEDAKEEAQFMKRLNSGHEFWCQAGIENRPRCSCKTVPDYLTYNDVQKRYEIIRNLAAAKGDY